jgi:hypothetical protein
VISDFRVLGDQQLFGPDAHEAARIRGFGGCGDFWYRPRGRAVQPASSVLKPKAVDIGA